MSESWHICSYIGVARTIVAKPCKAVAKNVSGGRGGGGGGGGDLNCFTIVACC